MKSSGSATPPQNQHTPDTVKPKTENAPAFTTKTTTPGKINQMARIPRHNTHARVGWARIRRAANDLTPQTIEQIAQRVAQLLTRPNTTLTDTHSITGAPAPSSVPGASDATPPVALLTAGQLAQQLGVTRAWVYENAHRLGAIRLGNGPRARLRFNPNTATGALNSSPTPHTPTDTPPAPQTRRPGRPRRQSEPTLPLLPVHEPHRRALTRRLHPIRLHPTHTR